MIVGVDASNLRSGGGVTHLKNLLSHTNIDRDGITKLVIWAASDLASQLRDDGYIVKRSPTALERTLAARIRWQQLRLPALLRGSDVDILFSPGGTIPFSSPVPRVTMFRNALPFETQEKRRYRPWTPFRAKLELLRVAQTASMRHSEGVICLSDYALSLVERSVGTKRTTVISHGIEGRFFCPPRPQPPLAAFGRENPFRYLYVSPVYAYKHHMSVVTAIDRLRRIGLPVTVDFIGRLAEPRAVKQLRSGVAGLSGGTSAARLLGPASFDDLHRCYPAADGFVFASSCENLPNTLLEAMAAGLPIASSNYPPMPAVLRDGGIYFDPDSSTDTALALETLARDDVLRRRVAHRAYALAQGRSWETTAEATWRFVAEVLRAETESSKWLPDS